MKLTKTQRLVLYALGQFYEQLNQPLETKPVELKTSKIAFIIFLLHSNIIGRQERTLYKNLEQLEKKKLIAYNQKMIAFTATGIVVYQRITQEVEQFFSLQKFFVAGTKPKQKLQTRIKSG